MNNVKVDKGELLEKLTANRLEHIAIYDEACEGYHAKMITQLKRRLDDARGDINTSLYFRLTKPNSHLNEYDVAIAMLEMSVDLTVEITAEQFSCYVLDKWSWMDSFLGTSSDYSGLASVKLGG